VSRIIISLAVSLALAAPAVSTSGQSAAVPTEGRFAALGPDVTIPVPHNWLLLADSSGFPAQLAYHNDSAEILIFRSEISESDMISNETELRKSVDMVIDEVISALPGGRLRTSAGFFDGYRTGFTLEFTSIDSATGTLLEHSLRGIIYRHKDQYQLLFTVWGKAAAGLFPEIKPAVSFVQEGLAYRGAYEDEVFAGDSFSYWPLILVIVGIVGLLLLRPGRRRSRPDSPAPADA
jgi:hypothetical protein